MIGKMQRWIRRVLKKLQKTAPAAAMKYILWYALFLALCATINMGMLVTDWIVSGKPNLSEMRQFINTMLSGSAVAAIGFAARWLVDQDGNGIPDEAEKDRPFPPYPAPQGREQEKGGCKNDRQSDRTQK